MAYTEIYIAKRNKTKWKFYGEVHNPWLGAYSFWMKLEEKYLEPLPVNEYGIQMSRMHKHEKQDEIWHLWFSPKITDAERLVLFSTFDYKYLPYDKIPEMVKAMREVHWGLMEGNSNFNQQADMLESIHIKFSEKEVKAVAINATSVSCHADIIGEKYDKDELGNMYEDYMEGVEWAKKIESESES